MPSTYSPNLRFIEQATGENAGTWGSLLNSGLIELVDSSVAGLVTINSTGGTHTLTVNNGIADEARAAILNVTGALSSDINIIAPAVSKIYLISNNTTGAHNVTINTTVPGTPLTIPQSTKELVYSDGTNFYNVSASLSGTASGNIDMNYLLFDRPSIKRYKEVLYDNGNISGAVSIDYFNGNSQKATLTGSVTLSVTNFPSSGAYSGSMTLKLIQDATGSRILTVPASFKTPGGAGITLSTTPNAVDILYIYTDDNGTTYDCTLQKAYS